MTLVCPVLRDSCGKKDPRRNFGDSVFVHQDVQSVDCSVGRHGGSRVRVESVGDRSGPGAALSLFSVSTGEDPQKTQLRLPQYLDPTSVQFRRLPRRVLWVGGGVFCLHPPHLSLIDQKALFWGGGWSGPPTSLSLPVVESQTGLTPQHYLTLLQLQCL